MELKKIYTDDITNLVAFAESRIGGRQENQDSYGWAKTPFGYLVTVCDGMGGGPGGKTASNIAVKEIIDSVIAADREQKPGNIVIQAIRKANMAILEAGNENPKLQGMGSTATVLLLSDNSAIIAHVGDSRVYQLRDGKKIFRTFDHSVVFEMVKQGVITEEQARLSSQSNVITRALGIQPDLEVELNEVPYLKGDRFVLCTDGIHGVLVEKDFVKILSNKKRTVGSVVDDMATLVDNTGRSGGGGHDNLTLAVVETNTNSKLKTTMTKQTRLTLLVLAAVCAVSIALNISQAVGKSSSDLESVKDSFTVYKDSTVKLKASVDTLTKKVGDLQMKN
ncbi:MAG: PP2C family protein-serine/threonine phosphatase [Prevotella sp.]